LPYISRSDLKYIVNRHAIDSDDAFNYCQLKSEEESRDLTQLLIEFAKTNKNEMDIDDSIDEPLLLQELVAFLLDKDGDFKYHKVISEFVLVNEHNDYIKHKLSEIREGGILYAGLSHDVRELGSIKSPLVLFLDTEILFDITGLNGGLYHKLAMDFINLTRTANEGVKKVHLKYFDAVKKEVDRYFEGAERVVEGKGDLIIRPAMEAIVKGCKDVSDVKEKQIVFYRKLQYEYGILQDERKSYYSGEDNQFNLEGMEISGYPLNEEANNEGLLFCSHINKLRKGERYNDYLETKYLFITDTRRVVKISEALKRELYQNDLLDNECSFAITLSTITNLLWYKLNKGFGSLQFPQNLDVVVKARTILSSYITQGITTTYYDIKNKYEQGELTADTAAYMIVGLKEKKTLPEELNGENVHERASLNSISLDRASESMAHHKTVIDAQGKTISSLKEEVDVLTTKLERERNLGQEKQNEIDSLEEKVKQLESFHECRDKQKGFINLVKFLGAIILKLGVLAVVVLIVYYICTQLDIPFSAALSIFIGLIGLIPLGQSIVHNDYTKYIKRTDEDKE
jgi:hypothetical protein